MPLIELPNKKYFRVPEGLTDEEALARARDRFPFLYEDQNIVGRGARALGRGISELGESASGIALGARSAFGDKEGAQRAIDEQRKSAEKEAKEPRALSFEQLQDIYKTQGLGSAISNVPSYITEQVLQSAPSMAAPLAAGAYGTALGGPLAGAAAGIGTYGLQQFGQFMNRQAATPGRTAETLEPGTAAVTAAATAPLGFLVDRFTLGLGKIPEKTALNLITKEIAARSVGKTLAVGAAKGLLEVPTEVLEQAAERYQAGLSLTDKEAVAEYKEAAAGALAVGTVAGAGSAYYGKGKAEEVVAKQNQFETARRNAETAAIEERQKGFEALPGAALARPATKKMEALPAYGGTQTDIFGEVGGAYTPLQGQALPEGLETQQPEMALQDEYRKTRAEIQRVETLKDRFDETGNDREYNNATAQLQALVTAENELKKKAKEQGVILDVDTELKTVSAAVERSKAKGLIPKDLLERKEALQAQKAQQMQQQAGVAPGPQADLFNLPKQAEARNTMAAQMQDEYVAPIPPTALTPDAISAQQQELFEQDTAQKQAENFAQNAEEPSYLQPKPPSAEELEGAFLPQPKQPDLTAGLLTGMEDIQQQKEEYPQKRAAAEKEFEYQKVMQRAEGQLKNPVLALAISKAKGKDSEMLRKRVEVIGAAVNQGGLTSDAVSLLGLRIPEGTPTQKFPALGTLQYNLRDPQQAEMLLPVIKETLDATNAAKIKIASDPKAGQLYKDGKLTDSGKKAVALEAKFRILQRLMDVAKAPPKELKATQPLQARDEAEAAVKEREQHLFDLGNAIDSLRKGTLEDPDVEGLQDKARNLKDLMIGAVIKEAKAQRTALGAPALSEAEIDATVDKLDKQFLKLIDAAPLSAAVRLPEKNEIVKKEQLPVIRDANGRSRVQLAAEITRLTARVSVLTDYVARNAAIPAKLQQSLQELSGFKNLRAALAQNKTSPTKLLQNFRAKLSILNADLVALDKRIAQQQLEVSRKAAIPEKQQQRKPGISPSQSLLEEKGIPIRRGMKMGASGRSELTKLRRDVGRAAYELSFPQKESGTQYVKASQFKGRIPVNPVTQAKRTEPAKPKAKIVSLEAVFDAVGVFKTEARLSLEQTKLAKQRVAKVISEGLAADKSVTAILRDAQAATNTGISSEGLKRLKIIIDTERSAARVAKTEKITNRKEKPVTATVTGARTVGEAERLQKDVDRLAERVEAKPKSKKLAKQLENTKNETRKASRLTSEAYDEGEINDLQKTALALKVESEAAPQNKALAKKYKNAADALKAAKQSTPAGIASYERGMDFLLNTRLKKVSKLAQARKALGTAASSTGSSTNAVAKINERVKEIKNKTAKLEAQIDVPKEKPLESQRGIELRKRAAQEKDPNLRKLILQQGAKAIEETTVPRDIKDEIAALKQERYQLENQKRAIRRAGLDINALPEEIARIENTLKNVFNYDVSLIVSPVEDLQTLAETSREAGIATRYEGSKSDRDNKLSQQTIKKRAVENAPSNIKTRQRGKFGPTVVAAKKEPPPAFKRRLKDPAAWADAHDLQGEERDAFLGYAENANASAKFDKTDFREATPQDNGVDLKAAADVVARVKKALPKGIKFVYAPTLKDAPPEFLASLYYKDMDTAKGAVLPDGTVVVIGEAHKSTADLEETIAHELIGHYGVDTVLGPERMQALVDRLFKQGDKHVADVATALNVFPDIESAMIGLGYTRPEVDLTRRKLLKGAAAVMATPVMPSILKEANQIVDVASLDTLMDAADAWLEATHSTLYSAAEKMLGNKTNSAVIIAAQNSLSGSDASSNEHLLYAIMKVFHGWSDEKLAKGSKPLTDAELRLVNRNPIMQIMNDRAYGEGYSFESAMEQGIAEYGDRFPALIKQTYDVAIKDMVSAFTSATAPITKLNQKAQETNTQELDSREAIKMAIVREMIAHAAEGRRVAPTFTEQVKGLIRDMIAAVRSLFRNMGLSDMAKRDAKEIQALIRESSRSLAAGRLGIYRTPDGEIAFRKGNVKMAPGFEDIQDFSDSAITQQKSILDRLKADSKGLAFKVAYVDQLAAVQQVADQMTDSNAAMQMLYNLDQSLNLMQMASASARDGALDIIKVENGVFRIAPKKGASLRTTDAALAPLLDMGFNAEGANQLFTSYIGALRGEQVGYDKLNFSDEIQAKARRVLPTVNANKEVKAVLDAARKEYNAFNKNNVTFLEKTGAISKEEADRLRSKEDYIPYYRDDNGILNLYVGGETPIRIGNLKDQPYLQRLVGGDQQIMDYFTSSMQNTMLLTDMGLRNIAVKNASYTMLKLGIAKIGNGNGPTNANVVRFKDAGKPKYAIYNTENTPFANIPTELIAKGMEGMAVIVPDWLKMMALPAQVLRKGITLNPLYSYYQLFKDSMIMGATRGVGFSNSANVIRGVNQYINGGKLIEEMQSRGIASGQGYTGTMDDVAQIRRHIMQGGTNPHRLLASLEARSLKADGAVRAMLYQSYIKQGLNERDAEYMSRTAMPYHRRGISPGLRFISHMLPFFNAQIVGLHSLYQSFTGKMPYAEKLKIRKKLWGAGMMLAMSTLAYAASVGEEDWYKNMPLETRLRNWLVKLPFFDEPIAIPIPFEYGILFKGFAEATYLGMFKDGPEGAKVRDAYRRVLLGIIPGGTIPVEMVPGLKAVPMPIPTAAAPVLEIASNKSFFDGRDIESQSELALQPAERYRDSTSELAKALGKSMNVSPLQIDHLIRGYTGTVGPAMVALVDALTGPANTAIAPKADVPMSKLPIMSQMFKPADGNALIDLAFETLKEAESIKKTYERIVQQPGREREAETYLEKNMPMIRRGKMASQFQKNLADIKRAMQSIQLDTVMTSFEKRQALKEMQQIRIDAAKQYQEAFKQAA